MKKIRQSRDFELYRTDDKQYFILRKKDKKQSKMMSKDEAEALIMDEAFNKECKLLNYE